MKKWVGLGLGTAALTAGLAACGGEGEANEAGEGEAGSALSAPAGELGEGEGEGGEGAGGEGEGGEGGTSVETLPLPQRLAFMTGHVEAGLALYRAGEPEMAAPHLRHPVSESYEGEREGLDALGFDPTLFETVSQALAEGRPAAEVEAQLEAAEENLAMVAEKAGGDTAEIIEYLMGVIAEEYAVGVTEGEVTDAGEFQDAYGFAVVARDRAAGLEGGEEAAAAIDKLIALWPEGPVPTENPAPVGQVTAMTSQVLLALPRG